MRSVRPYISGMVLRSFGRGRPLNAAQVFRSGGDLPLPAHHASRRSPLTPTPAPDQCGWLANPALLGIVLGRLDASIVRCLLRRCCSLILAEGCNTDIWSGLIGKPKISYCGCWAVAVLVPLSMTTAAVKADAVTTKICFFISVKWRR